MPDAIDDVFGAILAAPLTMICCTRLCSPPRAFRVRVGARGCGASHREAAS